jgi:hypothetical protein
MNKNSIGPIIFLTVISLTSCAPSVSKIQEAIAQTQAAWTPIPTQTPFPTYTPQPTIAIEVTRIVMVTATYTTTPLYTPTIAGPVTYILEDGVCLVSITFDEIMLKGYGSHPGDYPGCTILERKQITLSPGQSVKVENWPGDYRYANWCTLQTLDHNFVIGNFDSGGAGHATCKP